MKPKPGQEVRYTDKAGEFSFWESGGLAAHLNEVDGNICLFKDVSVITTRFIWRFEDRLNV